MPAGRLRALRRAPIALIVALLLGGFIAPPVAALDDSLTVAVAASQAIIAPGSDAAFSVEIANPSSTAAASGNVTLALSGEPLADAAAIGSWMNGEGATGQTRARTSSLPTPAKGSTSVGISIPAANFSAEGAWGVEASVNFGAANYRSRTVVSIRGSVSQAEVSTLVALTVHEPADGLFDAETLSKLTASDGELGIALTALLGQTVSVGIDPRILASIRALGSSAPASAISWLNTLQSTGFDTFALQYADADPALQAQLGLEALLGPGDFSDLGLSASEQAQLTSWNYSRSLVWPALNTVSSANLELFGTSGYQQVVLGSGNVTDASQPLTTVGSSTAIIAQTEVSAALANALTASSAISSQSANNVLQAELALLGGQRIVLAPNRPVIANAGYAASALAIIANSAVSRSAALGSLAVTGETSVVDQSESAERLATGNHILERTNAINQFSAVAVTPTDITEPARRTVLALFGAGWVTDANGWTEAVAGFDVAVANTLNSVRVVSSSTINVLASEASLPFTVENELDVPVAVWVSVSPSNGRMVVGEPVEAEIAANSRQTVRVPVKARIGNGAVTLNVTLLNQNGVAIGDRTVIPANVQADWEGWGAGAIALIAAGLFSFGIWRQVRKVRRDRSRETVSDE